MTTSKKAATTDAETEQPKVTVRMVGNSVGHTHGEEVEVIKETADRLIKNRLATEVTAKSEK